MRRFWDALQERALTDLFVIVAFLAVFGVIFYRHRLPEWLQSLRADGWRIAQGSVETGDVTAMRTSVYGNLRFLRAPELARACLGYCYNVDGTFLLWPLFTGIYGSAEGMGFCACVEGSGRDGSRPPQQAGHRSDVAERSIVLLGSCIASIDFPQSPCAQRPHPRRCSVPYAARYRPTPGPFHATRCLRA